MIETPPTYTTAIDIARPPKAILKKEGLALNHHGLQQKSILKALFKSYFEIFEMPEFNIFQHPGQIQQLENPANFFDMNFDTGLNANPDFKLNVTSDLSGTQYQSQIKLLVHISYCTREDMQHYNHSYRDKNYATNILTFPSFIRYSEHIQQQIDLLLCPSVIYEEALSLHKSLFSHYAHLYLHGLLHGFGFDHEIEEEAIEMETLETAILKKLGFVSPY
jgi:probable rRNA maturation factor